MTAPAPTHREPAAANPRSRPRVVPPGPRELPFVGSTLAVLKDPLAFLMDAKARYGDVVRLHLPGQEIYVFNHPDAIEEAVRAQSDSVIKDGFTRKLDLALGKGLLTSDGEFWKRQRRLAQPAFHRTRVKSYGEAMVRRTEGAVAGLLGGAPRDVHADLMHLTLDIVAETLFGIEVRGVAHEIGEALEVLTMRFAGIGIFIPIAVPTPGNLRTRRALARLDEIVYGIIRERRAEPDTGDLLSMLIAATTEAPAGDSAASEGGGMSDKQLRDEVVTLMLAGHETTALTVAYAVHQIAAHPHVQDALAEESSRVLGGRSATVEDLPLLPYADAVIKETLRLYSPAWSIGREATAPCHVGGYDLAPGTQIWAAQWVVHRDPRYFDGPEQFLPERWKDDLAKRLPRFAYFPFGGGPRLCIGNAFAQMEAVLLLVTLAQRIRFDAVPSKPLELVASVTLRPKTGVWVRPTRR